MLWPQDQLTRLPKVAGTTVSPPDMSRPVLSALATAAKRARELHDEYVSTEHLLVGLASDGGQAATMLRKHGATPEVLLEAFEKVRGSARVTSEDPEDTYQALEKFGIDLTQLARDGELDPVIGRDSEIRRVIQVLSAVPRTTRSSSASRGSARPPSSRATRSGSWRVTCRSRCAASAWSR
jgi:ATP-dependent Clp protease ATP-binding subunit ClpB